MSSEWQPIETAPEDDEIDLYREDCGVFVGIFTSLSELIPERELEQQDLSEDDIFEPDWFAPGYDGFYRVSNDGNPTHWRRRPEPPK